MEGGRSGLQRPGRWHCGRSNESEEQWPRGEDVVTIRRITGRKKKTKEKTTAAVAGRRHGARKVGVETGLVRFWFRLRQSHVPGALSPIITGDPVAATTYTWYLSSPSSGQRRRRRRLTHQSLFFFKFHFFFFYSPHLVVRCDCRIAYAILYVYRCFVSEALPLRSY